MLDILNDSADKLESIANEMMGAAATLLESRVTQFRTVSTFIQETDKNFFHKKLQSGLV